MALEIRSIPVLTGETAERFVREAEENERNPQRRKLVFSFEDIDRIMDRSRKYMKEHGGKVPSASDVSSYNREANEIQKRVTEANDRGNVGAQYQVMKEYAKKYGWNLTRKRTS